ncbi:MAG: ComF family protein [Cyanobacteria bacterium J06632_22]
MFSSLLRTFLKPPCPLCDRTGQPLLCRDCEHQLDSCRIDSSRAKPETSPIFAWGNYGGALKRAIHLMKYENVPDIGALLGQRLGQCWLEQSKVRNQRSSQRPLVLVPVPLHRDRLRQRGFNQAEIISARFSQATGIPHLPQGLLRVKATAAQHQLSPKDRKHNLKGAFRLGPDWTIDRMSSRVLLIDDIYTTGTTARAAATELRRSGISVVGIAAVARAQFDRSHQPIAAA